MKKIIITFEDPADELAFLNIIEKYKLTDFINDEFNEVDRTTVDHEFDTDGEGNMLIHYTSEKEDIEPKDDDLEDIDDSTDSNYFDEEPIIKDY